MRHQAQIQSITKEFIALVKVDLALWGRCAQQNMAKPEFKKQLEARMAESLQANTPTNVELIERDKALEIIRKIETRKISL